jgi:tetratricopeptide (TPR) repeat protein
VLNINPDNVLAYFNRASVFLELGRYREAMDDYSQAINLYPDFAKAYMNRSYVKNKLGQFNSAQADYDIAQKKIAEYKKTTRDTTAYAAFADTTRKYDRLLDLDAEFAKKDFNDELLQYRDVDIRLKPLYRFVAQSNKESIALVLDKKYSDEKVDAFQKTIPIGVELTCYNPAGGGVDNQRVIEALNAEVDSDSLGRSLFAKAILESENKQFNIALDCYSKAIQNNPSEIFYYINRGAIQSEMIDFISSIENNVQVLTLDNAGTTKARVKEQSTRSYDYTAAIHDMKKAASLYPEFPFTYYNLGNLYCQSNDLPEAIRQYEKAISLYPNIGEAYYNKGLVLIYLKDKEKGCIDLSKAGELGIEDAYSVIKKYCTEE